MKDRKNHLINYTEISRILTGKDDIIRSNQIPDKHKSIIDDCNRVLSFVLSNYNTIQKEDWLDVCDYEGLYKISNTGKLLRLSDMKLYEFDIGYGEYCIVGLTKNKNLKSKSIHRLVASAFIPNPENKPCVNHIDFNRSNNNVNNLEWVTYKENSAHYFKFSKILDGLEEQRSIQLPPSVWNDIELKAKEEKRSVNTTIEWAFVNYLKDNPVAI